jgi:hypothetical protein
MTSPCAAVDIFFELSVELAEHRLLISEITPLCGVCDGFGHRKYQGDHDQCRQW